MPRRGDLASNPIQIPVNAQRRIAGSWMSFRRAGALPVAVVHEAG
jgi:hypothetical protein